MNDAKENSHDNAKAIGFAVGFTLAAMATGAMIGYLVKKVEGR